MKITTYEESALNRVLELTSVATQLAPAFTGGMDFSERGSPWGRPGEPTHYEMLAERAFTAAEAFLKHRDDLLAKAAKECADKIAAAKLAKEGTPNG